MKRTFLIVCISLFNLAAKSQELGVKETLNYINENLDVFSEVSVNLDGNLVYNRYTDDLPEIKSGEDPYKYVEMHNRKIDLGLYNKIKDFTMDANVDDLVLKKSISNYNNFTIEVNCKRKACWTIKGGNIPTENKNELSFNFTKERSRDKVFNALKYLIGLIKNSDEYNHTDSDPFADENFSKTYSYVTGNITTQNIDLTENGGVYLVKTTVNGIEQIFILDSGASDVSISSNFERELISKNKIKKEDYIESALYRIADGSIISVRRVILNEIKIGDFIVNKVVATIGNNKNSPFLLGRGFLDNFTKWSIDNSKSKLTLTK